MKTKWICGACGKQLELEKDATLSHMREAHSNIFSIFPNPLVPKDNIVWVD